MKKSITFLSSLLFLLSVNASAQTFAPLGAEWYYDQPYGIFHLYVSGDTVINNIPCRTIVQKAITNTYNAQLGLQVSDLPTLYVYNNDDTVFVYNDLFNRFTPLYVYNVTEGDTVQLPIIQSPPNFIAANYQDSTFSFIIDSVRIAQYDTAHLKTIYTHPLGNPNGSTGQYVYTYGNWAPNGRYIASIGQVNGGLLPTCVGGCANPLDESVEGPTTIRCYNDSSQTLKFSMGDCDPITSAVAAVINSGNITFHPNPTTGRLYINAHTEHIVNIAACDVLGNKIPISFSPTFNEIETNGLANGIYYFTIFFDNQSPSVQKVLIQN